MDDGLVTRLIQYKDLYEEYKERTRPFYMSFEDFCKIISVIENTDALYDLR